MEEINKIISAITEVTGLDKHNILCDKSDESKSAREILCYIVLKDQYGLTWKIMEMTGWRKSQVFFAMDRCTERMNEEYDYLVKMNEIRKKLCLAPIYSDKANEILLKQKNKKRELEKIRSREESKRLFGIQYTDKDEDLIALAKKNALSYMIEYCEIGDKANSLLCN